MLQRRSFASRSGVASVLCALALAVAPAPAAAKPPSDENASPVSEGGLGILSGCLTLAYTPTKILYAVGGLAVAGLVYAYSGGDGETVSRAVYAPLRGDYVVTRAHVTGKKKLRFLGKRK